MSDQVTERLHRFKSEIVSIRQGVHRGRTKPHKPILLLTVMDLLARGDIAENRIGFDEVLIARFEHLFSVVKADGDWCHPSEPYFHLRTSGFWFHKPKPGKEKVCAEMDTSGGGSKRILGVIEYAFFDPDSFSVLCDRSARSEATDFVIGTFFGAEERAKLMPLLSDLDCGQRPC